MNQAQLLAKELNKYDPVSDGKGGFPIYRWINGVKTFLGYTKPGGHYNKILDYRRGLLPAIWNYIKNCMDCNDDEPPNRKLPKDVWDVAYKRVPVPVYPVSPLVYVPGSDRLWQVGAVTAAGVSLVAGTIATGGLAAEAAPALEGLTEIRAIRAASVAAP